MKSSPAPAATLSPDRVPSACDNVIVSTATRCEGAELPRVRLRGISTKGLMDLQELKGVSSMCGLRGADGRDGRLRAERSQQWRSSIVLNRGLEHNSFFF